jgi:hypothetical protein
MATFVSDGVELGIETVVNGHVLVTEGTSASAPLVAAIFTRLGLTTEISNDLGFIYKHRAAFNDIGSPTYPLPAGSPDSNAPNNSECGILCIAGHGWDGPSGVGSPNGAKLSALLPEAAQPASDGSGSNGCTCEIAGRTRSSRVTWLCAMFGVALALVRRERRQKE